MQRLTAFLKDDSGAVTVDWVVLTAAVVGMAFIVLAFLKEPIISMATYIGEEVMDAQNFFDY
jgi:hypothetical protein